MQLTTFGKVCIAIAVVMLLAAIGFALWKLVFTSDKCEGAECLQLEHIIYKGRDSSLNRDVYYALNREENEFQAFGTGFNIITQQVHNIQATSFQVSFDYGNNVVILTEFRRGSTLATASVVIDVGKPSQRTIDLKLTTIEDLSGIIKGAIAAVQ